MKHSYDPNPIITVFIEIHENKIEPVCYELIGKAKELTSKDNMEIYAILVTNNRNSLDLDQLKHLVDHIDIYEYEEDTILNLLNYRDCLKNHIYKRKPRIVLIGATPLGRSFAPRVAAHFATGITADCTELQFNSENGLIQIRPAYGGDVIARILTPKNNPQMATVRPGVFELPQYKNVNEANIKFFIMNELHEEITVLEKESTENKITKLDNAELVILAGNAIKYPEELNLIKKLAKLLNGEWAVTRSLVEGGLAPHNRQVGISGKTIRPKLLMAFGVSGTTQTLSGISKSEKIIAINVDENSPIFLNSDIGIIENWEVIAKGLIEKLNNKN